MTNLYSLQKKPENLGLTDVFINFREIFEKCQFLYILVERWNEIPYAEIHNCVTDFDNRSKLHGTSNSHHWFTYWKPFETIYWKN